MIIIMNITNANLMYALELEIDRNNFTVQCLSFKLKHRYIPSKMIRIEI